MEISKKKWHFNLYNLVRSADHEVGLAGYIFWTMIGFIVFLLVLAGGGGIAYGMRKFAILHPELIIPIVYGLGGLIVVILVLRIPFVKKTFAYLWSFTPTILPSVKFVE